MEIRPGSNPRDVKGYDTCRLREEFLCETLFQENKIELVYTQIDRIIFGSAVPTTEILSLPSGEELGADFFLQRREMGIINVGDKGTVTVDEVPYELGKSDGLYISMGTKEVLFDSEDSNNPAQFYINSCPAHMAYPTLRITLADAAHVDTGSSETSNERTINKYIHPDGAPSCQLVMGMTELKNGSVWNTMPVHTHDRRMEVYFYFDIPEGNVVFHLMGEPDETRHIVVKEKQAVISPSWSIHSGAGTSGYTFIWGMCGENQTYSDVNNVSITDMK
jgi:4-deoxy-L-threo-5-hexosulose-uronate ketol-isomerase